VVEDNDDSRWMLESMLKLDGHEVHVARDGGEGLRAMHSHRPALAIVDVGLPVIDGSELARKVRGSKECAGVYLVALTGYGRPEDQRKVFDAGFYEHLVKPLKRDDLERVLDRAQKRH
jgi:two-component system, chemotaxis family, CheB/CheR fusion protein